MALINSDCIDGPDHLRNLLNTHVGERGVKLSGGREQHLTRDCHSADALSPSLLIHLLKAEGSAVE